MGGFGTDLAVVTDPYSTLCLQKGINRGRYVHEKGLEPLYCFVGGIGTLIPLDFPYMPSACVAELGG